MHYEIRSKLGDILRDRNITQAQLSEMSGVLQGTISRIVNGNQRYNIEHLFRIADALGLKVDDLFEVRRLPE